MKQRPLIKRLLVISALLAAVITCGSPAPTGAPPTQALAANTSTPTALADTPTTTPEPAPTQTPQPTATPTIPQPTTAEPEPSATQEPPTATLTPIMIPELTRTLSLQTPFLEGEDVMTLQEQLSLLGYVEVGVPDGVFGGMTENAVKHFQEDHDLAADGVVGPQTWDALFQVAVDDAPPPETEAVTLYARGAEGEAVEELEDRLAELGYSICEADDYFDAQTEFAVTRFQIVKGLEADGVVGPQTWDALFSEDTLAAPLPERQISPSAPVEVGSASGLAYDGKSLWVARNDFGPENDAIGKLDPYSGAGIARNTIKGNLGETMGYGGKKYPLHLHPRLVAAEKNILWVAGRASGGTETGTPTLIVIKPSGNMMGDPIFVGTSNIEVSGVAGFFEANNKIWAVVNEPYTVLYELSASPVKVLRRLTLYDIHDATGAAYDGTWLWLAGSKGETPAIWAVNLENGSIGQVLGVCGEKLAFDGRWIWAAQTGRALAVEPESRQVMAATAYDGSVKGIASDGKGQIWILTAYNADTFLQHLKTR